MAEAPSSRLAAVAIAVGLSAYGVHHIHNRRFYNKSKAWMVTILTFYISPVLAVRHLDGSVVNFSSFVAVLPWLWIFVSSCLRRIDCMSPFSLVVCALEVLCAVIPLTRRLSEAVGSLNVLIVPVFWIACFSSTFSSTISFVPLDRHLRLGPAQMWRSRDAHDSLLASVLLHGAVKVSSAMALGDYGPHGFRDAVAGLCVYWILMCSVAFCTGCGRPYPVPAPAGLLLIVLYLLAESAARVRDEL